SIEVYTSNQKFIHHRLPRIQAIKPSKTRRTREEREELHERDQLLANPRRLFHSRNFYSVSNTSSSRFQYRSKIKTPLFFKNNLQTPQKLSPKKNKTLGMI